MTAQAIGSLFVQLGLDSAQFQQGLRQTQSNLSRFGANMAKVSAGIAAAGATAFAAFSNSAARLGDLRQQAEIAGLSAQEFKVAALAVDQFGVSQEQLSDILKDVNDKFGDFAATGGGELKDFFENIAPKVGVTIDSFKKLNSSDALALYVSSLEKANVSQQEMTFYMEALANDATALVPAFRNGAQAMEEARKKAEELGLQMDDGLGAAAAKARSDMRFVGEVLRTEFDQAVVQMAPQLQKLTQSMIPVVEALASVAQSVLDVTDAWGKGARQVVDRFIVGMQALPNSASSAIAALAAGLAAGMSNIATQALDWGAGIVRSIIEGLKGLYEAGVQAVRGLAAGMAAEFTALKDRALGWGRDIADGLRQGLNAAKDSVRSAVTGLSDNVKGWFTDEMEIQSPSRVFMRFGGFIADGLRLGIKAGDAGVQRAMQDMARGVASVFQAVLIQGASFRDSMRSMMGNLFGNWSNNLFSSGMSGLLGALDPLSSALRGAGLMAIPAFGGFRANGGDVWPGRSYIVGENGPELFSPSSKGHITPNGGLAEPRFHVTASFDEEGTAIVKRVTRMEVGSVAPQIVNRSVGATRKAMGKSKRGWGI